MRKTGNGKNREAGREREINAIEVKCSETFSEKPVLHLTVLVCAVYLIDVRLSNLQTTLTKVGNITAKTTDMLLKARAEDGKVDVYNMVRMNTDALT